MNFKSKFAFGFLSISSLIDRVKLSRESTKWSKRKKAHSKLTTDFLNRKISKEEYKKKGRKLYSGVPLVTSPYDYKRMIEAFLNKEISADNFTKQYLNAIKNEPGWPNDDLLPIIQDLFEDIICYSPFWTEEDEKESQLQITEKTLRIEAEYTLSKLNQYLIDHPETQEV